MTITLVSIVYLVKLGTRCSVVFSTICVQQNNKCQQIRNLKCISKRLKFVLFPNFKPYIAEEFDIYTDAYIVKPVYSLKIVQVYKFR